MTPNQVNIGVMELEKGGWYVSGTVWISTVDQFHFYGREDGEKSLWTEYTDHVAAQRAAAGLMMELALDKTKFLAKHNNFNRSKLS